jgi:2-methylcitrate dehydratase PrpD
MTASSASGWAFLQSSWKYPSASFSTAGGINAAKLAAAGLRSPAAVRGAPPAASPLAPM